MNYKDIIIKKLEKYKPENIIITEHTKIQALRREISLREVKENILHPKRLTVAIRQNAQKEGEEKYDCYFAYSNTQCQRYILVINKECVVCTVIKINRRWQRIAEKNAKI